MGLQFSSIVGYIRLYLLIWPAKVIERDAVATRHCVKGLSVKLFLSTLRIRTGIYRRDISTETALILSVAQPANSEASFQVREKLPMMTHESVSN